MLYHLNKYLSTTQKNEKDLHWFNVENLPEALWEPEYIFSKIFIYSRKGFAECKR